MSVFKLIVRHGELSGIFYQIKACADSPVAGVDRDVAVFERR
ncbi:MAG: hypothetical protein AAF125_22460 [Chloroflexota bacterium]